MTPAEIEELVEVIATRLAKKIADAPVLIDRYELSRKLGVSVPTVERYVRAGRIPVVRLGRRTLFELPAVLAALREEG